MARRFTRRKWRRPQRLTLEGPAPGRRKDVVVAEPMTLEPAILQRENRSRIALVAALFVAGAALEGLALGALLGRPLLGVFAVLLALVYLSVAAVLGDGWIQTVLGAQPRNDVLAAALLPKLAGAASIAAPKLLVAPGGSPNAFSFGLRRSAIVLTDGATELAPTEQEALLAHEVAHVRAVDSALATLLVLVAGGFELATKALRAPGGVFALLALPLLPACLIVRALRGVVAPDGREHRADVEGALLTRYPPGMVRALRAAAVEQSDSTLRTTDPFWAAPRIPRVLADLEARASRVQEM